MRAAARVRIMGCVGSSKNGGSLKYHVVNAVQRHLFNPLTRRSPWQQLLETTGRRSGEPRSTPIGGKLEDNVFWWVSEHGAASNYVRNIEANPQVRVRINGRWRSGTARAVPDDDARKRLASLPATNSRVVAAMGTDLLTMRADLEPPE